MKKRHNRAGKVFAFIIFSFAVISFLLSLYLAKQTSSSQRITPSKDLSNVASTETLYWIEKDVKSGKAYLVCYDFGLKSESKVGFEAVNPRLVHSNFSEGVIIFDNISTEDYNIYAANQNGIQLKDTLSDSGLAYVNAFMNGAAYECSIGTWHNGRRYSLMDGSGRKFQDYAIFAISENENIFAENEYGEWGLLTQDGNWLNIQRPKSTDGINFNLESSVFKGEDLYVVLSTDLDVDRKLYLFKMEAGSDQLIEMQLSNGEAIRFYGDSDEDICAFIGNTLTVSNDENYIAYKVESYIAPGPQFTYHASFIVQSLKDGSVFEICSTLPGESTTSREFYASTELAIWG